MKKNIIFLDLCLFLITVVLASYEQWSAKDLVWSLWISSLILGYSYILASLLGMLFRGDPAIFKNTDKQQGSQYSLEVMSIVMNIFFIFPLFLFRFFLPQFTRMIILSIIGSSILCICSILKKKKGWGILPSSDNPVARRIILLPGILFLLGFFTVHFAFFHPPSQETTDFNPWRNAFV